MTPMGAGPGWPSETLITVPPHVNCVVISVSVGHGGWGVGEGCVCVGGWVEGLGGGGLLSVY